MMAFCLQGVRFVWSYCSSRLARSRPHSFELAAPTKLLLDGQLFLTDSVLPRVSESRKHQKEEAAAFCPEAVALNVLSFHMSSSILFQTSNWTPKSGGHIRHTTRARLCLYHAMVTGVGRDAYELTQVPLGFLDASLRGFVP